MARINPSWFEFKDIRSDLLGVRVMDAHVFSRGELRGSMESVAGRSGYVWTGDGASEAFEVKRVCRALGSRLREISAWLAGPGRLRFSGEPGAMYDARIVKAVEYKRVVQGRDPLYEFSVIFSCQPHPWLWPEAQPKVITERGALYLNPGTAPALPRVEVIGAGYFSLTIGGQTLFFSNVKGGIVVDSELGDALSLDGTALANDCVDGELFQIQPGRNAVSWTPGGVGEDGAELPGSIEKVTITPRWRWM